MRRSALALLCLASLWADAAFAASVQKVAAKSGRAQMFGRPFSLFRCEPTTGFGVIDTPTIEVGNTYKAGKHSVTVQHIEAEIVPNDIVLAGQVAFHKGQTTCRAYGDRKDLPVGGQCGRIWIYIADCAVLH